jgi:hypothetical protein
VKVSHEVLETLVVAFGCSYFLVAYDGLDVGDGLGDGLGEDVGDVQLEALVTSVVVVAAVAVLKD